MPVSSINHLSSHFSVIRWYLVTWNVLATGSRLGTSVFIYTYLLTYGFAGKNQGPAVQQCWTPCWLPYDSRHSYCLGRQWTRPNNTSGARITWNV